MALSDGRERALARESEERARRPEADGAPAAAKGLARLRLAARDHAAEGKAMEARPPQWRERPVPLTSIARIRNGSYVTTSAGGGPSVARHVGLKESNALYRRERRAQARRVAACLLALAVLAYVSLGVMGAQGHYYVGGGEYAFFNPLEVANVLYHHAYNAVADATNLFAVESDQWLADNVPGYWAVPERAAVIGVTLVCAVLLSVSGMLYQNVFRNPIAGPGLLGVSTGTSLGVMVLVLAFGAEATVRTGERYALCYAFGAAILAFVLAAGWKLSRKGRSVDAVSLMLVGSIVSQLLGSVVTYVTLFVMDEGEYSVYFTVSQMLVVDTSALSWACLGVACAVSLVPVFLLRARMNALSFDEDEVRVMGIDFGRLRAIALVCGAVMILAAQIHTGMVGLVSLIVPFVSRRWFGCEFGRQLAGNVCVSTLFLLACRDAADLVPFVGDGIAIGNMVGVMALPVFLLAVAKQRKGQVV